MRSQLFNGRMSHDQTCQSVFIPTSKVYFLNSKQVKRSVKGKFFKVGISLKDCKDMETKSQIGLYYAHLPIRNAIACKTSNVQGTGLVNIHAYAFFLYLCMPGSPSASQERSHWQWLHVQMLVKLQQFVMLLHKYGLQVENRKTCRVTIQNNCEVLPEVHIQQIVFLFCFYIFLPNR